jgi:hypothetical protein
MRDFRKAVAALATTGIAALGVVAATGGVASAGTNVPLTGCSVSSSSLLSVGLTPSCSAGQATMFDPTGFAISVNPSFFNALGALIPSLGETVNWTLQCSLDGRTVTKSGTLNAMAEHTGVTIDPQSLVGSPVPNSCTFTNLTATSTEPISGTVLALLGSGTFNFGVSAIGNNGVPGAVWAQYPADADGAGSSVCADVPNNGNHGAPVQAYQCEDDLADMWTYLPTGQLVHNGDCLDSTPNGVLIDACQANPSAGSSQRWLPEHEAGPGVLTNAASNECLTAPASGIHNGTRLTVAPCSHSDIGQQWHLPPVSPGV